jgi:hypothetical protein
MRTQRQRLRGRLPVVATAAGAAVAATAAIVGWSAWPSEAAAGATPTAGGEYTLAVAKSGMCLDVTGGATTNGALLQQWGCAANATWQQFRLTATGSGRYQIVSRHSGLCLDVPGATRTSGTRIQQWGCATGQTNQMWTFTATGRGYQIISVSSGLCLSDKNASTDSGNPIIQETCTVNTNKLWTLTASSATPVPSTPGPTAASPTPTAAATAGPTAATSAPVPASPTPATVTGVTSANWFVSPTGSDSGAGTLASPYATLAKAVSVVKPGQTIAMRGGTYKPGAGLSIKVSGTAGARIVLSNYANEQPVIDAVGVPANQWAIAMQVSYWTVQGLEIKNGKNHPLVCTSCQYATFQRLSVHDNLDTGFTLRGDNTIGNQILNSDFYLNHDDATLGQNADGIAIKFGSGSANLIRGCRMFNNADDGIDLWAFTSPITIESSWAYGNGVNRWHISGWEGNGNGFKLGGGNPVPPVKHIVRNNAAWDNTGNGFTENSNAGSLSVTSNTAYRNGSSGFFFKISTSTLTKNLALANKTDAAIGSAASLSGNSWSGSGWSVAVLRSTDPASAQGARQADGTLPATTFLVNTKDTSIGASMTG